MAEAHPVGFQWVMEAKSRGATIIHVDPRFTRTSAVADIHVPIRAGTDMAFLGGLVNYVLSNEKDFREYVVAFTNAAAILRADFVDSDDLDGLFSGFDAEARSYDTTTWQYAGVDEPVPQRDESLQHPRCVYQVLRRHFARYTPEMVQRVCGITPASFAQVAEALTSNSGRERTSALCYAVGWTHHSTGAQMIRTAAILQTLLGNVGRPGGGILALRGHASIQGSTDIPTLYNLLPGYIPMPRVESTSLDKHLAGDVGKTGFWGNSRDYVVSLMKAWWGDAATADNDFCFGYLPRLTGNHGTYQTVLAQIAGDVKGYFVVGENPSVGSANARLQRQGLANLEWLVVRDLQMIETATFWKDGPEIETGEMVTADIGTEVFFLPAAAHTEKAGSFTNTQRLLQWHHKAVEPPGDARSDLWFYYHLGRIVRDRLAASTDARDRPLQDLTWDYPVEGESDDPSAEAVLAEIGGFDATGAPVKAYTDLKDDGSTSAGCWIYCGVTADGVNQSARRKPGREQSWVAPEWGWAWPANRRTLYNRASADRDGKPWSARKAYVWWDEGKGEWTGHDVPDFEKDKRPDYTPPPGASAQAALAGDDAFIMQGDGKAWLFAPSGLADGPLPAYYEPPESPVDNPVHPAQQRNPLREIVRHPGNTMHPSGSEPGGDVFPYVFSTHRLTEHHTAGGMSRTLPYLSELQPAFFIEVGPGLAEERGLEHLGWATVVTARSAIGPGPGDGADATAASRRPHRAPGRHPVALGTHRADHRRCGQRDRRHRARSQRAHPGQGRQLRRAARASAAGTRPARLRRGLPGPRRHPRRRHRPASQ